MLKRWQARIDSALGRVSGRRAAATGSLLSLTDEGVRPSGLLDYTLLYPPRRVTLQDERQCDFLARQKAVTQDGCAFQTEKVFQATLADVTFDPHSGAVWTADGSLIVDSIKNAGRLKHVTNATVAPGTLQGLYSSIAGPIAGNTFHWLIESLPRLALLARVPQQVVLLMPDTLGARRREQLISCLPSNVSLRLVPANARLFVERFILPSFLTTQWDFAYLPPDCLAYVRDRLYEACGLPPEPGRHERIYITRGRARVRRVTNEEAVLERLRPLGFRPYLLEDLPFAEQVRLFHDAEMVIAPHGAGLANLLFSGPIPVVEFVCRALSPVYFFLALALGQDYRYLYPTELRDGEKVPSPTDGRRYSAARDLDFTVDLDSLDAVLNEWR